MSQEELIPFCFEEYSTPNDTLIKGGPHKHKDAYCYKKTFALGSSEAQVAHKKIEELKAQGCTITDITEAPIDKVESLLVRFDKEKLEVYNWQWNILERLEHIREEKSSRYIIKDIKKEDLLAKEQTVLSQLDYPSLNAQEKEKLYNLLKDLKETKQKIAYIENILFQLDKTFNKEAKPVNK